MMRDKRMKSMVHISRSSLITPYIVQRARCLLAAFFAVFACLARRKGVLTKPVQFLSVSPASFSVHSNSTESAHNISSVESSTHNSTITW